MDVNFSQIAPDAISPVIFEQILGEKPGGGVVANPTFDVLPGTAVGLDGTALKPIKAYRLLKAVAADDTTIEIAKGSGVEVGDAIGVAKKAVACTAVDTTTYATKDVVTITLGVAVANGKVLYQAAGASASSAVPKYTPSYLTGAPVLAGKGDQLVKLINIANVRKETINTATEVLALLPTINAV
jgi:hypothetical protein